MKKILVAAWMLISFFANAQQKNTLLNGKYWSEKPTLEQVKKEIAHGNNPAEANAGNHDVVSMAINNGASLDVIQYLIDQPGNSVDKNTHDGRLYIHWAASKGNVELVKYLIQKGSSITQTDDKGATPLSFAASNGQANTDLYELFFQAGVDPKATYQNGANALLLSISADKDLKLANYLTTKGLSLHDVDEFGRTAFDYAARTGNVDLLKKLINQGVKPTHHALIIASEGGRGFANNLDLYKFLIEEVKIQSNAIGIHGENVLHNLVKKEKQEDIINYFIQQKVDINAQDANGNTAFMIACGTKNIDLVTQLLPMVKDINKTNKLGETALFMALQSGNAPMTELLLSQGADAKIISKKGTAAHVLIQSYRKPRPGEGHDDFSKKIDLLKNYGVDFAQKTEDGSTILHLAIAKNDIQLLQIIEKLPVDINAQDELGMTALHKAAMMSKDDQLMKHLISMGANTRLQTELDETPFDLASENEYLKEHNINIDFLKQ